MRTCKHKNEELHIEIDTSELEAQQVRLLGTINALLAHVAKTEEEPEFFEASAELMKQIASLIKQSNFITTTGANPIPYAEQALEYSLDNLVDIIHSDDVISFDN